MLNAAREDLPWESKKVCFSFILRVIFEEKDEEEVDAKSSSSDTELTKTTSGSSLAFLVGLDTLDSFKSSLSSLRRSCTSSLAFSRRSRKKK
jgi:hypothetical protein